MDATLGNERKTRFITLVIGISIIFILATGQSVSVTSAPTKSVRGLESSDVATNVLNYDCRRPGAYCDNDRDCNNNTGRCECDDGENFYCRKVSNSGKCSDCMHGDCLNGTQECVCHEGYYGVGCKVPRVDVECNVQNMTVYIYPYGQFAGDIFVKDDNLTVIESCKFKPVTNYTKKGNHTHGFYLVLDHISDTCSNATFTEEYGNLNYTREFFLEYVKHAREDTDQIITVSCEFTPSNTTTLNGTILIQSVQSDIDKIDVFKDTSVRVSFTVTEKGSTNTNSIAIGQDVVLKFVMEKKELSAYNDFIVSYCDVKDGLAGKETTQIRIIEDDCPTAAALPLITKNINSTVGDKQMTVSETMSMKAFVFLGESNSTLTFECVVEFCAETCNHPPQPCQGSTTMAPYLRKRRAAENEQKVSAQITVVDPASQIKATSDQLTHDCLQQPSLIAIISTLGGLVLLFLILCIILTLRLLKSSKKQKTSEPQYELRIPRMSLKSANGNGHCD